MSLMFWALGEPKPQGSMRAFVVKGRPVITSNNPKMNEWRQRVATEAQRAITEQRFNRLTGAVHIQIRFFLPRPKCIKDKFVHMTKRPDADKLTRAVLDALTGIAYDDDSQIVSLRVSKDYAAPSGSVGAWIMVSEVTGEPEPVDVGRE